MGHRCAAQEQRNNKVPAHISFIYDVATKYRRPVQVLPNNDVVKAPHYKERDRMLNNKEDVKTGMTKACQAMLGLLKEATA